jgi:hypothetical protein
VPAAAPAARQLHADAFDIHASLIHHRAFQCRAAVILLSFCRFGATADYNRRSIMSAHSAVTEDPIQ